ncbi:uncharacterized protein LOC143197268 isoform X37 [Rhynchophorus ferrugineus]|uniref:uncharacterized protein LOC143197268 isoform X37 n=1 Tax=Rhynchophorus ferrugineus TaxID=354439 RepID=UPI003FCCA34A
MEDVNEPVVQSKVRNLVHAYENQTTYVESASEQYSFRRRSKSIGHALTYKLFRDPNLQLNSLLDIEKEVVKLDTHLNYYEYYDKETHVAFLEQLFEVFKALVSIDPEGCETTKQKKAELIAETQKLSKTLNAKLPYNSPSKRLVRRIEVAAQREDNIVTTTGNYEVLKHSISSEASNSSFNKSTESLSSLKDSSNQLKISNDNEQSTSQYNETTPDTTVQSPTEIQDQPKPKSVSKLTRFFSFRESKPSIPIIPSAYSGVSRSASTTSKTNKYIKYKEFKSQQKKVTEEHFKETEEEEQSRDVTLSGNEEIIRMNSTEEEVEKHQSQTEIEVAQGEQNTEEQKQPTVSVSKLKNFFEERKEEENEGNYLNFVRVLRSTDITKTVDINKSKSMPNLLDQEIKPEGYDDELDENITSQNGKESSAESINDLVFNEKKNNQQEEIGVLLSSSNQVKVLKETFEKMSSEQEVQVDPQEQQEVNAILHREITPEQVHVHGNPEVQISNFSEPALKVPIQLRLGPLINTEEVVTEGTEDTQETTAEETKEQTEEIKVEDVKEESSSTTHEKSGINMTGSILLKSTDLFKSSSLIKGIISQQAARETIVSIVTAEEETAVENPEQQNNITEHDIETNDGGLINKQVITGSETIVTTANSVEEIVVPSPEEQTNITERDVETRTKVVNQQATPGSETTTVSAVDETVTLERQNSITEHHVKTNPEEVTNQQATTGSETIVTTVSAVEETQVQTPEQPNNNAEHDVETNTIEVINQQATTGSETNVTTVSAVEETQVQIPEQPNNNAEHDVETNTIETLHTQFGTEKSKEEIITEDQADIKVAQSTEESKEVTEDQVNSENEGDNIDTQIAIENTNEEKIIAQISKREEQETQAADDQDVRKIDEAETIDHEVTTEETKEELIRDIPTAIQVKEIAEIKEATEDPVIEAEIQKAIAVTVTNNIDEVVCSTIEDENIKVKEQVSEVSENKKVEVKSTNTEEINNFAETASSVEIVNEKPSSEVVEIIEVEGCDRTTGKCSVNITENIVSQDGQSYLTTEEELAGTESVSSVNIISENPSSEVVETFEVEEGDGIRKSGTITRTKTITRTIVSKGGESYKITSSDFNNTKDQQLGSESELLSSSISSEGESTETPEISNFTEHASSVNIVNENPSEIVETFEEDNDGIRKTGTITRTITRTVISKGKQSYTTTSQDMNNMIGELVRTPEIDNLTESVTSLKVARENTPEVVKTFEVEDDESNNKSGSIRTTIIRTTVSEGGQIYTTTSQDIDDINGELVKTPEMSNLMESTTLAEDSEGTRTSGTVTRVITRTIISEGGQSYTTTSQDIDDISGELVKSPEISNLTESKTSVKVTSENLPSEVVETFEAEDAEGTRISGTVTKTIKRTIVSEGGQRYTTTSQDIDDINGELVKTPEISNLAESTTSVKVTTENLPSEVVETFAVENGEGNIKSGTITRTVTSTTVSKGGQSYTTTTKDADNINVELENTPEISNFAAFTAGIKVTSENPLSEVVETFEGEDGQGIRKSTTVRRTVTRTTVSKGGQSYISTSQGANDIKVDLAKTPEISNFTESGTIVKVTNENPSSEVVETFEVEDGEGNKKSGTITRTITRTVSKSGQSNLIPTDIIEKINDPQALVNGSTSRTVTTIRKQVISKEGQQGNSQIEVFVDAFCDDVQLEQEQPQIINKKHSLTVPDLKFNNINVSQEIPPSQLVSSRDDEDSSVFDENAITGTIQGSRISNATGTMKLIKTKIRKTSSVSLNESQEDIIDQILSDDDDIEHLEEDFEKLVKENMN